MSDIPLSIVIPTLGYECLNETVSYLNNGPNRPKEIIIVIPEGSEVNAGFQTFENVMILKSPLKGQVKQRIFGFKHANEKYILQLDDDIWIDQNNLKILINSLMFLEKNSAIAPVFLNKVTGKGIYNYSSNLISNFLDFVILKSKWGLDKMGTISEGGINFGIDHSYKKIKNYPCDWLAGGCILHHSDQVYLENYFPFDGKAYCEDLIHSYFLKQNGINLYVNSDSFLYIDWPPPPRSKKEQSDSIRAQRYFIRLSGKSNFRFNIFILKNNFLKLIHLIKIMLKRKVSF